MKWIIIIVLILLGLYLWGDLDPCPSTGCGPTMVPVVSYAPLH